MPKDEAVVATHAVMCGGMRAPRRSGHSCNDRVDATSGVLTFPHTRTSMRIDPGSIRRCAPIATRMAIRAVFKKIRIGCASPVLNHTGNP